MPRKPKEIEIIDQHNSNDANVLIGIVYLLISILSFLAMIYSGLLLIYLNKLLGIGCLGLSIFTFFGALNNFSVKIPGTSSIARITQFIAILFLAPLGYVLSLKKGIYQTFACIWRGDVSKFLDTCNLPNLTGSKIVETIGTDAGLITLVVMLFAFIPLAFDIDFLWLTGFIYRCIMFVYNGVKLIVGYIMMLFIQLFGFVKKRNEIKEKEIIQENIFKEMEMKASVRQPKVDKTEKTSSHKEEAYVDNDHDEELISKYKEYKKQKELEIAAQEKMVNLVNIKIKQSSTSDNDADIASNDVSETIIGSGTGEVVKSDKPEINLTLRYPDWKLPSLNILLPAEKRDIDKSFVNEQIEKIELTYSDFGVEVKIVNSVIGPTVTQYQMQIISKGVSVKQVIARQQDVALNLSSSGVRIGSLPDSNLIGIEVAKKKDDRLKVTFKEICEELRKKYTSMSLGMVVGKAIDNKPILIELRKMPHLLVAGTTGSGKSVFTNSLIMSVLMTKSPDEVQMILIDPKKIEFSDYDGIPHLRTPVIVEADKAMVALKWCVAEMDKRYGEFAKIRGIKDIDQYNQKAGYARMPYIVIIIDEFADLISHLGKNLEIEVGRLVQKARAVGIHLVLATQRPSVDVITGVLKANVPGRVGLKVAQSNDSRVILDENGAETLVGYGDLLLKDPTKNFVQRIQGVFVDSKDVAEVIDFIKYQDTEYYPDGNELKADILADQENIGNTDSVMNMSNSQIGEEKTSNETDLFKKALQVSLDSNKFSFSNLQTYLGIGFNKAKRLGMEFENAGYIYKSVNKPGSFDLNREKIHEFLGVMKQSDSEVEE